MPIEIIFTPAAPNNPFEGARRTLIRALAAMPVPAAIGSFPVPSDFTAIGDHLREAAALFDAWLGDIGHQVSDNAPGPLDLAQFTDVFLGAIDGNATYVCEQAAEMLRQDVLEMAS